MTELKPLNQRPNPHIQNNVPEARYKTHKKLVANLLKEQKKFEEFLTDALKSPKLTSWEQSFTQDLMNGYKRGILMEIKDLSEKQRAIVKRITSKIYAIG